MANKKISQLDAADLPLSGYETTVMVQAGYNVQASSSDIANWLRDQRAVQLGYNAYTIFGESSVAIGAYSYSSSAATAVGPYSTASAFNATALGLHARATQNQTIAVGAWAYASAEASMAIGYDSQAQAPYSIAVGSNAIAHSVSSIAIGNFTNSHGTLSIAVGQNAYTSPYADHGIAIGASSLVSQAYGIAIGSAARAQFHAVSIGHLAGYSSGGDYSIAIGSETSVNDYAIAIGLAAAASAYAVSIGYFSHAIQDYGIAIGTHAYSNGYAATAIGMSSTAGAPYAVAIGGVAVHAHSIVLGRNSDMTSGSFVVSGYPSGAALIPTDHYQKFIASTIAPVKARVGWTEGAYTATVSAPSTGEAGNSNSLVVMLQPSPDGSLDVAFADTTLTISLGTDGDGLADNSKNTLAAVAALFPVSGFTFDFTGSSSEVIINAFATAFIGGSAGNPEVVMTSDGNAASGINIPALATGTLATLTGRVVGCVSDLFSSDGDAICFILQPVLLLRKNDSTYTFINDRIFTLENATIGAMAWSAPTLTSGGFGDTLTLTVSNNTVDLDWMAHLRFEASQ